MAHMYATGKKYVKFYEIHIHIYDVFSVVLQKYALWYMQYFARRPFV